MKPLGNAERNLTTYQAWSLYALHAFTSTTGRTYDFAAIVFTASLFPESLTAASIRGVSTTIACVCLSPALGRWVDASASRLKTLSTSIWAQQGVTVFAYILWALLVHADAGSDIKRPHEALDAGLGGRILFGLVVLAGIFVKLGSITNDLVIDREWLPVLVPSSMFSDASVQYDLTHLNAGLRRIDLVCKILTPFFFNFLVWFSRSAKITAVILLLMSVVCCFVQLKLAKHIYESNPALRTPKESPGKAAVDKVDGIGKTGLAGRARRFLKRLRDQTSSLQLYFSTIVWIPSISWTMLHFTVLAYSASLITYLLEVGFSLTLITLAQGTGSAVEIASTFLTPWIIHRLSHQKRDTAVLADNATDNEPTAPRRKTKADSSTLEKVGLWGISWQFFCLIPVVATLFIASSKLGLGNPTESAISLASLTLFALLSLSRAGYWSFELTTQELTQTLVPADQLSTFAGTQQSFQSFFELNHWIATAIWSTPDKFPYLALGSLFAVGTALSAYFYWFMKRRRMREWEEVLATDVIELIDEADKSDGDGATDDDND